MSQRLHLLLFAVGLALWTGSAIGQQPEERIRVARLVRQLGDNDHLRRRAASDELEQLGAEGQAQLEEAAASSDPEVRLRAAEVLSRRAAARLWAGSEVVYQAKSEPAARSLARLAELTGNHVLAGEQYGSFRDESLEIDFQRALFWEAVDDVCRRSGNRHRPHYDARVPGIIVSAGTLGNYPTAYAGPVRAQITSARRGFAEELDYEQTKSDVTHTFQLNLQATWEDRFRLVAYAVQPQIESATTDTGAKLGPSQPGSSGWNVASSGTRLVSSALRLSPPPAAARTLRTLKLTWPMVAVGQMATLETDELVAGRRFHQDDLTLTLQSIEKPSAARCELVLVAARDLAAPEPPEVMFQENEAQLIDVKGHPLRLQSQSHQLSERGVELRLAFVSDSAESTPHKLRFNYPKIRSRRDLEIVFRDIPLPTARPE